jgi:hypothetical protein
MQQPALPTPAVHFAVRAPMPAFTFQIAAAIQPVDLPIKAPAITSLRK